MVKNTKKSIQIWYKCPIYSPPDWSSTGLHIGQLDLLGIADYIVFVNRISNVCAKLKFVL